MESSGEYRARRGEVGHTGVEQAIDNRVEVGKG